MRGPRSARPRCDSAVRLDAGDHGRVSVAGVRVDTFMCVYILENLYSQQTLGDVMFYPIHFLF